MRYDAVAMLVLALGAAACSKVEHAEPEPSEAASPRAEAFASAETPAGAATEESTASAAAPTSPAAPAPPPLVPTKLSALGTEPFWNARIDGAMLTYTTPEDQSGKRIVVDRRDTAIGAVFSGTIEGAPLILTVTQRPCSDGMSDRAYSLRTVLTIGSQRRIGCAS